MQREKGCIEYVQRVEYVLSVYKVELIMVLSKMVREGKLCYSAGVVNWC